MVIARGILNLVIIRLDAVANGMGSTEVEGSTFHLADFTRRNILGIRSREAVGIHVEHHVITWLSEVT